MFLVAKKKGRRKKKATEDYSNTFEVQLLEAPTRALMSRLKALHAQWPGHEILHVLLKMCHRLLYASVADPLVKVIAGVQLLLYKAQQWESYVVANCVALCVNLC